MKYAKSYLADTMTVKEAKKRKVLSDEKILLVGDNIGSGGGGEGKTYTFENTDDGWNVVDSDGQVFTHVDETGVIKSQGPPNIYTEGEEGMLYVDTLLNDLWIWKSNEARDDGRPNNVWVNVADGNTSREELASATIHDTFTVSFNVMEESECTVNSVDEEKLLEFVTVHKTDQDWGGGENYMYFSREQIWDEETGEPTGEYYWMYQGGMGGDWVIIYPEDMLATTGIDVTVDEGADWAQMGFEQFVEVDLDSPTQNIQAFSTNAVKQGLCFTGDFDVTPAVLVKTTYNERGFPTYELVKATPRAIARIYAGANLEETPTNFGRHLYNATYAGLGAKKIGDYNLEGLASTSNTSASVYFTGTDELGDGVLGRANIKQNMDLLKVKKIGNGFMNNCIGFNGAISAPLLEYVGYGFLQNCSSFDQPLSFVGNLKYVGDYFLQKCSVFNQPLNFDSATYIGEGLLYYCENFNKPLTFNENATLGLAFTLSDCTSFNQDLKLPRTLKVYNQSRRFLYNCNAMEGTVDLGDLPATYLNTITITSGRNALFSTQTNTSAQYQTGITLKGTYVADWINALPNRTSSPYRKLINGGASPSEGGNTYEFTDNNGGWKVAGSDGSTYYYEVDTALDTNSVAPVQNKVLATEINTINDSIGDVEEILRTLNTGTGVNEEES